jgi:hypothetical protein
VSFRLLHRVKTLARARGTCSAIDAFAFVDTEVTMPFSLMSYLLGVGTVVGALVFSFGSGVLVTNIATKETAAGPKTAERVVHAEPEPKPPLQAADAKEPQAANAGESPAPSVDPAPTVRPDPVYSAHAEAPKPDARSETEGAKQLDRAKQTEPAKQAKQSDASQRNTTERTVERQKRYAELKSREIAAARMKQRKFERQDDTEQPAFVVGREEPRFDVFEILEPRSFDHPGDRDDRLFGGFGR